MTQRMYLDDVRMRAFTARVAAREDTDRGCAVRLDRTAFYPASGGQPCDTGTLNGVPVTDVWEDGETEIWHLVERAPEGERVEGKVDPERRFDHMQQHTGQHVLSEAFIRELDADTVAVHIGSEASTVDLESSGVDWEAVRRVEDAANRVVWENRPVTVQEVTEEEVKGIPLRRPPKVSGRIRVVLVEDFDASACGGTHVTCTGEVGLVKVTGLERYKGGTRVTFVCGARALGDYRGASQTLRETCLELSVGREDLRATVARVQEEAKATRGELEKARVELMAVEADRLWSGAAEEAGVRRVVAHWTDRSFSEARAAAIRLRDKARTVALLAVTEARGVRIVCARSSDLPEVDAGAILRAAAGALGGKGGGSSEMAQGGAGPHEPEAVMVALQAAVSGKQLH